MQCNILDVGVLYIHTLGKIPPQACVLTYSSHCRHGFYLLKLEVCCEGSHQMSTGYILIDVEGNYLSKAGSALY